MRQSAILAKYFNEGINAAKRLNGVYGSDLVFMNILHGGNCHASHILRKLLKEWEIYQIRIRIEREINKQVEKPSKDIVPANDLSDLAIHINTIASSFDQTCNTELPLVNTGHFLIALLGDKRSISSRVLESYHITEKSVHEYLAPLPPREDYYEDMLALEQNSSESVGDNFAENNKRFLAEIENQDYIDGSDCSDDDLRSFDQYSAEEYTGRVSSKKKSDKNSLLDRFGTNLTLSARDGKIDPVIGRDKEIERMIQILGRRKKNNPILIGEAGVGKSAIVEGLALRIVNDQVPHTLRSKLLFSLDIAALVAGTKYRGEFEERIKALIDELNSRDDIILFIDEIHTIVGAGSTQGSLDTANILKPALARGQMQCIGATTLDEYRENIETDSALERRFQKIVVEPTTKEETLQILYNIKSYYQTHHRVKYSDDALHTCVNLADRYITDRQFPDKAIDVLDEAGSRAHICGTEQPKQIIAMERAIEQLHNEKKSAISSQNYGLAAELRTREIALRSKLTELNSDWQRDMCMNPIEIGSEQIEHVITSMTGIPVEKVSKDESHRLRDMGNHLERIVIGQSCAVDKVVKSIQRSRAGLKDPNKPIGVFMFVGPTGVGKTHLAKELSQWLFDKREALIRIDMSEYSEKHNVSRLIGSPPGYVGYNEGGQLTEAVRRQPYAVVLFDEIEKAHPDVFNIMLQIFDEGQLTDGLGNKIDFRNTIIIMTSNVGSRAIASKGSSMGYSTSNSGNIDQTNKDIEYRKSLESTFAPEFINRIDDIVIFNTLSIRDVSHIVDFELGHLISRAESLGYKLRASSGAKLRLAEIGYEPRYGVRSLKRTITELVEEPLAQMIVGGEITDGDYIKIGKTKQNITLTKVAV